MRTIDKLLLFTILIMTMCIYGMSLSTHIVILIAYCVVFSVYFSMTLLGILIMSHRDSVMIQLLKHYDKEEISELLNEY